MKLKPTESFLLCKSMQGLVLFWKIVINDKHCSRYWINYQQNSLWHSNLWWLHNLSVAIIYRLFIRLIGTKPLSLSLPLTSFTLAHYLCLFPNLVSISLYQLVTFFDFSWFIYLSQSLDRGFLRMYGDKSLQGSQSDLIMNTSSYPKKLRVLVVDDDAEFLTFISGLLKLLKHEGT